MADTIAPYRADEVGGLLRSAPEQWPKLRLVVDVAKEVWG